MGHHIEPSYIPRGENEEGTEFLLFPLVTKQCPAPKERVFLSCPNKSKPENNYTKALLHISFEDTIKRIHSGALSMAQQVKAPLPNLKI